MKKNLFIIALMTFSCQFAFGQVVVNGKNINEDARVKYLEVSINKCLGVKGLCVEVDFGQEIGVWSRKQKQLTDTGNKTSGFNSKVALFNFLFVNGWEYVSSEQIPAQLTESGNPVTQYLFRRRNSK
ncbi:hypothetical protein SAMN04515674_11942 [Pseudarcicella hirudinis]|uniref:Uncharacterized protein n=1 Tax=Pseudarcicella hirudinis TaxID=1079859 RepID=A0A1I5YKB2_9BACT|nr:hypothetical protein [Pseudarcicella hirudinis]SFQ44317.1 hypothetical protein SAMN04515674_11942 [Pseudarcicella hirudinis]